MSDRRELHLMVPELSRPTGGNVYDRRVARDLAALPGWSVRCTELPGRWPSADAEAYARLARALAAVPDGGAVLIDGLVACAAPEVIEPAAARLDIVVLVHLPLPDETGISETEAAELAASERRTLHCVAAVVVTSPWAARRLAAYGLPSDVVHVAPPGTDSAPLARGSRAVSGLPELLCVAAVTPRKDQLTLVAALAQVAELAWNCTCVGPADGAYAAQVRADLTASGLDGRVRLVGPRAGAALAASYDAADLCVLASRTETFGMVITEALSRGLPVVTTAGGAAEETLGVTAAGATPGLLVPPGQPAALAAALRRWLSDAAVRSDLATAALQRRDELTGWDVTVQALVGAVDQACAAAPVRS